MIRTTLASIGKKSPYSRHVINNCMLRQSFSAGRVCHSSATTQSICEKPSNRNRSRIDSTKDNRSLPIFQLDRKSVPIYNMANSPLRC